MEAIAERINLIKKEMKFSSDGKFADHLGIGRSNYAQYLNGKRIIGEGVINKICIQTNTNKEWLATGVGSMFVKRMEVLPPEKIVDIGRILEGYLSQQETIAKLTQQLADQTELVKAKQVIINDLSEQLRLKDAEIRFKDAALKAEPTTTAGGGESERQAG